MFKHQKKIPHIIHTYIHTYNHVKYISFFSKKNHILLDLLNIKFI